MSLLYFLISRKLWLNLLLMFIIVAGILYWSKGYLDKITHHGKKIEVPSVEGISLIEAKILLERHKLGLSVDSTKFKEEYSPFQVYDEKPPAGSFVKEGRSIAVKANPRTFKPVKLPNLIDRSIRLARQHLYLTSLKIGEITYEPYVARDVVLKVLFNGKKIQPGEELPRYATVDLVLGGGDKVHVEVPNLSGLTLVEASSVLSKENLSVGKIVKQNVTDSLSAMIIQQSPAPGAMIQMGELIDVWISNHFSGIEKVP